MSKEPGGSNANQEVVELVNKLGGRQAEVFRKEFNKGHEALNTEVKGLASTLSNNVSSLQELKGAAAPSGSFSLITEVCILT